MDRGIHTDLPAVYIVPVFGQNLLIPAVTAGGRGEVLCCTEINAAAGQIGTDTRIHNLTGNGLDETGAQKHFGQRKGYTIPYGCLVPKKVENLLLAGRDICGTHMAHSNYRVMPICANMGQAAGVAASLCVKQNVSPRKLDVAQLQERLGQWGVAP